MQRGDAKDTGKSAMPYSVYSDLCHQTIQHHDSGSSHAFPVTQWNLMTNQEGAGPKDPRHIYAIPFCPNTCWITALAVYLACNPLLQGPTPFPGANQKGRYCKLLSRSMAKNGATSREYGTHSVRKGVTSFAASGNTGAPSMVSICLQCGWSLGGCKIGISGAKLLGASTLVVSLQGCRTIAPILPPHFVDGEDQL
ncbi:TPA: hypothetical protein N0F65_001931 [Lagenidium giganteum]|uniref:Uncharacterized protein n=1 Tax=Lagenidium giganteum TaxID=4803 RepID=A0AAV2YUS8_9STRA|nr:TPA: hypothetical protein N0F65_001931 [Lagenidium giganteum]